MTALATQAGPLFVLRDGTVEDVPLIRDSWKRSYVDGGRAPKCDRLLLWEGQSALVTKLLSKPGVRVLVAVNPEDASQVFGWVCFEPQAPLCFVHFLYVKASFRGNGVARALWGEATHGARGVWFSQRTKDGDELARKWAARWNPFLVGGVA